MNQIKAILLHVLLLADPDLGHLTVSTMIWSVCDGEWLTAPNGEDMAVGQSRVLDAQLNSKGDRVRWKEV